MYLAFALLPASLYAVVSARLHSSRIPEDPYAFPKYRVTYLNGLPVLNETAQRWLQDGLRGGELEFLNQPWEEAHWQSPPIRGIEGSPGVEGTDSQQKQASDNLSSKLELMKFGPRTSYICLIPPAPPASPLAFEEIESSEATPTRSWSLLQPLSGTCLYHKQGWFTYSYCHNSHVRQFHELANPPVHRPGEYKPEEDSEWEAYTLGRAPATLDPGADLTVAEQAALAQNVELARGSGSRYLVQRWGDGTYCDKTGRKREIEIQFHCSMTMTDTIIFVKETQTCHYVLHIATPRLCGEPGFKSPLDSREEVYIRCREILSPEQYEMADRSLPSADQPLRAPKRTTKQVIAAAVDEKKEKSKDKDVKDKLKKSTHDLIRQALEKMIAGGKFKPGEVLIEGFGDGDENVILEFVDADFLGDEDEDGNIVHHPSLEDVLRAAGFEVKGELSDSVGKVKDDEKAVVVEHEADPDDENHSTSMPKRRKDEL